MKEFTIEIGKGQVLKVKTDYLARQANGSVLVQLGETVVLASVVMSPKDLEEMAFFPLMVEYREKTYAAGKIPGGFFKREGKPQEHEILACREIDRPIRPLFPKWLKREVNVNVIVLSYDGLNSPDTLGIMAASIALMISDIPFDGPVVGLKLVLDNNEWLVNPSFSIEDNMNVINIAGKDDYVIMLEGQLNEVSEEKFLEGVSTTTEYIKNLSDFQRMIAKETGKEKLQPPAEESPILNEDDKLIIKEKVVQDFEQVYNLDIKKEKNAYLSEIVKKMITEFEESPEKREMIAKYTDDVLSECMRNAILAEGKRIDKRGPDDIRSISIEAGVLPRVHGSSLFQRGETQALVTATLGTSYDEQIIDNLEGDERKSFMLHYNFPPFSVGETGGNRGVSRREIGHGNLAEISFLSVLPPVDKFPYTIRIVSEILESNGSSSMATVCGCTLAMMDAGIPIRKPVAGVALGLVYGEGKHIILTDIAGQEDHWGDMDLKVTGTDAGITAIQMDLKINGISKEVFFEALQKARTGRMFILDKMLKVLPAPRKELSTYAPKIEMFKINPDKIGAVIGPGGKHIKAMQEETNTTIKIEEDGTIKVFGVDKKEVSLAIAHIKLTAEGPRTGQVYDGTVARIEKYGIFVELAPGVKGLMHVSEIADNKKPNDFKIGESIKVKIKHYDTREGKIDLTNKL